MDLLKPTDTLPVVEIWDEGANLPIPEGEISDIVAMHRAEGY